MLQKILSKWSLLVVLLLLGVGLSLSITLQQYLDQEKNERVLTEFETMISNYTVSVQSSLTHHENSLKVFADLSATLVEHAAYDMFHEDIQVFIDDIKGFDGLVWLAPEKKIVTSGSQSRIYKANTAVPAKFKSLLNYLSIESQPGDIDGVSILNIDIAEFRQSFEHNIIPIVAHLDAKTTEVPLGYFVGMLNLKNIVEESISGVLPEWLDIHLYVMDANRNNAHVVSFSAQDNILPINNPQTIENPYAVFLPGSLAIEDVSFSILFHPRNNAYFQNAGFESKFPLVLGIFITLSVCIYFYSQQKRTEKINALVKMRTTELSAKNDELRKVEERFKLATEGTNNGIWDWPDITQDKQYWSPGFFELLGYQANEVEASAVLLEEWLHAEDKSILGELHKDFLKGLPHSFQVRLFTKEKEYRWFRIKSIATRDDAKNVIRVTGVLSDINHIKMAEIEKQEMEAQLRQAQKLESIGQLAAGVAHEINTPIQFVGDNIRFLNDSFEELNDLLSTYDAVMAEHKDLPELQSAMEKINDKREEVDIEYLHEEVPGAIAQSQEGVERVSSIVKAMKEFSHPGSEEKQYVDINRAIESTLTVSKSEWKYIADVKTYFAEDLPQVACLPGEFNQTVLNMVVNAAHAIEDVALKNPEHEGLIEISTFSSKGQVEITISDNGGGMPAEVSERIFDPFFTTKEVGKGTGQGLSIAYSVIVDKHQGELSVISKQGQGTTFRIILPVHENQVEDDLSQSVA